MAQQIIGGAQRLDKASTQTSALRQLLITRLSLGILVLLGSMLAFVSLSWDIQWHSFVGRDRTLTPPHVFMLSSIVVCGFAALASVLFETIWARRHAEVKQQMTVFAGFFAAPLGMYITGYAALNSAAAFPLDQYWHTLYGIDVAIWAPFHIMVISGLALMAFGTVYTLASVANLASRLQELKLKRLAYAGIIFALGTALGMFTVMTVEGVDADNVAQLGFATLDLFPLLEGFLLASLLGAIALAFPWRWAATSAGAPRAATTTATARTTT